ncbi:related to HPM1-AdoMet-dependent methyltransferase [Sporisorium scitamineum]|uniref:protein-histidine N-methyltransferase n=1 Tax=Sporisorium scitamineum TaxID=49012 RepID=A0A0F7SD48_9BASI|nr:related to HPM1-AdoMet-dependent methyltransferase [Sporisorium scitamineum]CDW99380.1 hypothetical protein [Sporisorium scitamineum]
MSFGFQFDDSEMDKEYLSSSNPLIQPSAPSASTSTQTTSTAAPIPFQSHLLQDMLQNLPSRISYSSIDVSLPSGSGEARTRVQRLLRRDLFDARFQMLLDEDEEEDQAEGGAAKTNGGQQQGRGHVDADSDLIPGVYEGGLKTWECALDLVEVLDAMHSTASSASPSSWPDRLSGKHILELGCGTALPTLFILDQLLQEPSLPNGINLTLHLADYNAQVLQLVTLPNLILTWYASPASAHFRCTTEASHLLHERHELERRGQDHFDTENELAITDELVTAFAESLTSRGIHFNFYSGAWSTFPPASQKMDLILTSETIYSLESLPALVELLRSYAKPQGESEAGVALVAAKVIYFGVGGGVESLKQVLGQMHPTATVESLHSVTKGVGRTVLSVAF